MEHEVRRDFSGRHVGRVLGSTVHTVTDRACTDAGIALDAAGGLGHDLPEPFLALAERFKVMLSPLVAELEHRTLDLPPDVESFGICGFGGKEALLHRAINEVCTFLAADLDECSLAGTGPDNPPVPAG